MGTPMNRKVYRLLMPVCGWLLLCGGPVLAQERPVVFRGAAVETAGKAGRIEDCTVVLAGGKITAVGKNATVPDGARVIDARGQTIMPGIIDPSHEIRIAAGSEDEAPRTVVVRGRVITLGGQRPGGGGFTRIADNFYPYDRGYTSLARSGLTGLNLVTSGYSQSAFVRVMPKAPESMLQQADGVLNVTASNSSASLDVLRTGLGIASGRPRGGFGRPEGAPGGDGPPRRGFGGGRGGFGGGGLPDAPTMRLWQAVREGKAPLLVNADSAAGILHVLQI